MRWRLLACLVLSLCTGAWVQAQEASVPRLYVDSLEPHAVGSPIDVKVSLVGDEDRPLDNNVIEFYVDGTYLRRVRTDENGRAQIRIKGDLSVGHYTLTAAFIGTQDYIAVQNFLPFEIRPLRLRIETVPPLAGVEFTLNERRLVSDARGLAQVELDAPGRYDLAVLLESDTLLTPDTRVTFSRWNDAVFTPERTLELRSDAQLQVGLELSHFVSTQFTDLAGEPVAGSRVDTLTLKSSAAAHRTLKQGESYWLQANRIMRQREGIHPTPLQWSVETAMVDGSNVVNRYQQRFYVAPQATWTVGLLLYQARIRSRDALFGFSVGTGVSIRYPDGSQVTQAFDANDELVLFNLARGLYKLQVLGSRGVAPVTPVAMTRNQEVELKVLSLWDISALLSLGLCLSLGLLFYGRPHLLGLKVRRVADVAHSVVAKD